LNSHVTTLPAWKEAISKFFDIETNQRKIHRQRLEGRMIKVFTDDEVDVRKFGISL
jgi:uncharacterized ubiquitin-like protein YukD